MKRNLLTVFGILLSTFLLANGPFEKAMGKNIPAMFSAQSADALQAVLNQLDRIGAAEGDRWEPYYYQAYGYIRMTGMVEGADDKDKYLDLALKAVEKGESIQPNDSELESLRGYVHMIRVTVDPASRGMQYSGMAFASFQKAVGMNPENPRAHFLLGQMQYGTAQFMGSGTEEACGTMAKAVALYGKASEAANALAPSWGKENAEGATKQMCSKEE